MFSQFRNAVESIAQAPRASTDEGAKSPSNNTSDPKGHGQTASGSWGTGTFPAISTLGKLVQRPESPARLVEGANAGRSTPDRETQSPVSAKPRMTLEDRLKMRFVVGETSPAETPSASTRATPSPQPPKRELSPASTPLPLSPALEPTERKDDSPDSFSLDNAEPTKTPAHTQLEPTSQATEEVTEEPQSHQADEPPQPQPDESSTTALEVSSETANVSAPSASVPEPREADVPASPVSTATSIIPSVSGYDTADDGAEEEASYPPTPYPPPKNNLQSISTQGEEASSSLLPVGISDEKTPIESHSPPATPLQAAGLRLDTSSPVSTADVDTLRERLKLVEQRFTDVSSSFKRLQAEKQAVDKVLQELTPVTSVNSTNKLREYLENVKLKEEMAQDELKRLNGKLTRQEERLEELRDIHHLESKSMSDLIEKLRKQVADSEAALKNAQNAHTKANDISSTHKATIDRLNGEVEKAKAVAKEEEEKRTKAISLLKTVRQKLVKTEKERDDALKEANSEKEKEKGEREKDRAEQIRLREEIEKVNAERESAIVGIKAHFDREAAKLREKQDKEMAALKAQFEQELATSKANSAREISTRDQRITALERSVNNLTAEKNSLFEQSQLRQAEVESSQSHLESLQSQNSELNYQLRDTNERITLLSEELTEARRELEGRARAPSTSATEAARILALTQTRYEGKLADLEKRLHAAEKERNDGEVEWSKKLEEKTRELDRLKLVAQSADAVRAGKDEIITEAKRENDKLRDEIRAYQERLAGLVREAEKVNEIESAAKEETTILNARLAALEKAIEEAKGREAQLKQGNKTLKEELRKVQSSAALLEKQRNPGIGYYGVARTDSASDTREASRTSIDLPAQNSGTPSVESDVNLEYIRNVILQFLEHENMRPNLVRVLSAVLHFSPNETRRLMAKV